VTAYRLTRGGAICPDHEGHEVEHLIEIEVAVYRRTAKGELWDAMTDGQLIYRGRTPFFGVARVLLASGTDPTTPFAMRHRGSSAVALTGTIGEAVKWTVQEEPKLARVGHQEYPGVEGLAPVVGEAKHGPSRPRPVLDSGEGLVAHP